MADKKPKPIPVYVDRLPPCNNHCPVGQNIQKWLYLTTKDRHREAWEVIMEYNPIPATIGRVCYHPCEHSCNRYVFDAPVNINAVERFLGDMALEEKWVVPVTSELSDKKVLVVGAGPAGLAAAYHLRLLGYAVTIYEASSMAGGMMHYGIPQYRLPREILEQEIARICEIGVVIEYNRKVDDVLAARNEGGFAAVFVAPGAQIGRKVDIPIFGSKCQILDAVKFLEDVEFKRAPKIAGHKVVVYGGGNTAIDAARCAVRLGAKEVEIVYRRNREKMPAYDFEVAEAIAEGIIFRFLRTIKSIKNKELILEIMELDGEGWPCSTGKTEIIQADSVIMALGLNVDTEFLRKVAGIEFRKDGSVHVADDFSTGCDGLYVGGDVVTYDRSVATALGHGRKAARVIDAYIRGVKYSKLEKNELASQDKLHPDFYQKADRKERQQIALDNTTPFTEIVQGLTEDDTMHEAARCFSCGNCFECDTCYNVCPVNAITKLGEGKRYHINLDVCIRCGLCAKKCPCGAIKMVTEE